MPAHTTLPIIFMIVLSSLLSVADLQADSLRCGRKLVKTGDSTSELLRKCGEPRSKDRGVERVKVDGVMKNTRVERWYYKKSSLRLEHRVYVYHGRIAAIEVGGR